MSPSPPHVAAPTVKETGSFTAVATWLGADIAGVRVQSVTVMFVEADPGQETFVAVNVTEYVPACVKPGVQSNVPEKPQYPDGLAVNVAPAVIAVPEAVSEATDGPSGSEAVTVKAISEPSGPETAGGALTNGDAPPTGTAIEVDAEPVRVLDAVNVAVKLPPAAGVQERVPDVLLTLLANVAPAVMAVPVAVREVIASPSGSTVVTVSDPGWPMQKVAVAGAVTTGARSQEFPTRIEVDAEPVRVFAAVKVTP